MFDVKRLKRLCDAISYSMPVKLVTSFLQHIVKVMTVTQPKKPHIVTKNDSMKLKAYTSRHSFVVSEVEAFE